MIPSENARQGHQERVIGEYSIGFEGLWPLGRANGHRWLFSVWTMLSYSFATTNGSLRPMHDELGQRLNPSPRDGK